MKYALISDIHANVEALTATLSDIDAQGVDRIHCLGDVIGYGADPSACLELVQERCDIKLLGNHEYTALGRQSTDLFNEAARLSAEWTVGQLSERDLEIMGAFELDRAIDQAYLVHASPYRPDSWHYIFTTDEAHLAFKHLKKKLCFFGHSHLPLILSQDADGNPRSRVGHSFEPDPDQTYLVNIGAVGQPRDNDARASYVVFDDDAYEIAFHRVEYDIEKAQSKMTAAHLPEVLVSRIAVGR